MTRIGTFAATALLAGAVSLASGAALAQSDGYELAPGYIGPNGFFEPEERMLLNGYGNAEGDLPEVVTVDEGDGPLTSFAGQRRNYDPGVIGGVLGRVKQGILGEDE